MYRRVYKSVSCGILENEILTNEYIYPLVNREIPHLMSLRTGAQQPHINKEIVESINVVIPPQGILYAYIKKSKSLYKSIFINAQEIADLAKQRDELLPLLMNGQVLVNSDLSVYKKRRGKVPSSILNDVSDI